MLCDFSTRFYDNIRTLPLQYKMEHSEIWTKDDAQKEKKIGTNLLLTIRV